MTADRAIKEPCRAATTGNITLSGLQTIDGVALSAGDRVLVRAQTSAVNNGIYDAASGAWTRASDMDGAGEVVGGTEMVVTSGDSQAHNRFHVASAGPVTIGSSAIAFAVRDHVYASDFGFGLPGNSASANAAALQAAVDRGITVYLPGGGISFDATINVPLGTVIIGMGLHRTFLDCTASLAFYCEAPNALGGDVFGPKFAEFTLNCAGSGIKLNDPAEAFDAETPQHVITRPRIERVRLLGPGATSADTVRALDFSKAFHAVVDQCEIIGFGIGLKTLGSDFTAVVNRSRIWQCGILVQSESHETFGSGTLLDAADLLLAITSFIKSSDHHLIVRDCYFEHQLLEPYEALAGPVLDIAHNYMTCFTGNRFETPALAGGVTPVCPDFLKVEGEGTLFVFENNSHGGEPWGTVEWNGGNKARCLYTPVKAQKIMFRGNAQELAIPFNSVVWPESRDDYQVPWLISPDLMGPGWGLPYNAALEAEDGAYVLPAMSGYDSLIAFSDSTRIASGNLVVRILAKANEAGTTLGAGYYAGGAFGTFVATDLTTDWAWYKIFTITDGAPLDRIELLNGDTGGTPNREAHIRQIVVERAGTGVATLTWDPASLSDGAGVTSSAITLAGAAFGDPVAVAAPYDLQGIIATAYVSAAGTVRIRLQNETGGAIDLANGTWTVVLSKVA